MFQYVSRVAKKQQAEMTPKPRPFPAASPLRHQVFTALIISVIANALIPARAALPVPLGQMLDAARLGTDSIGVMALRVSDGAVLLAHDAQRPMQPASTLKTLTSIVALERLGPAFRGRTELRSSAEISNGELVGDLVLRGMGDVDLDWEALRRMLQSLRDKGIEEIRGDLVIDREWFLPARPDLGVPPFDETPEFRYNVIPDALLLNTNLGQIDLQSDGRSMKVRLTPVLDRVEVVNEMTLVDRACPKWEDGWLSPQVSRRGGGGDVDGDAQLTIHLRGEFPRNCTTAAIVSTLDRNDFADRLFRALWRELGGRFHGVTRERGPGDAGASQGVLLAEHRSRPLAEFLRDVNKRSDNPITRVLYLHLGKSVANADAGTLPTAQRAENVVRSWLREQAIDDRGLVLDNGSGLSRSERITPTQLASVLRAAYRSKWAPEFLSSLPIIGVDGAMQNRLKDGPAREHGRVKTGSLRDVFSVAGYVPDAQGRPCVVVAMINHPAATGAVARPILDAVIDAVSRMTAP
jgi:D-alanyl-D-alanine carboxypeptidase/D-alanyl-D-alanine-endopeptidase (penicillin-binding protein 4)